MKKIIIFSTLAVLLVAVPLLKQGLSGSKARLVEVESLDKRSIRSSTLASGVLTHEHKALISTEIIGRVAEVLVKEGQTVDKGQMLLRIDDTPYVSEVEQFLALEKIQLIEVQRHTLRVNNLKKNWKRQQKLFQDNLLDEHSFESITHQLDLSKIDLQTAQESQNQSRARLAQAQDRLNKTKILSPFAGIVTSVDIKEGEMAIASSTNIPGSSLMTVADPISIHTEVNVDEADIASIQLGQKADVFAIAWPDDAIEGEVEAIATSARVAPGRQGLSFAVKLGFKNLGDKNLNLRPGMSCRSEIYTHAGDPLLAVPIQALQSSYAGSDKEEFFIFIESEGRAKKITVELGLADDDYQAVEGELQAGFKVIIGPDRTLRDLAEGDKIKWSEGKNVNADNKDA